MNPAEKTSSNILYLKHWAILTGGFLIGLFAVAIIDSIPFDFSQELAEARRLGIVSVTTIRGYPKSRDILFYTALIILPVTFSLGAWLLWSKSRRPALAAIFQSEFMGAPAIPDGRKLTILAVVLVILSMFNINYFYEPISGWPFVGEAGKELAWAGTLLDGGMYARDFYALFGPLQVYLLAWTMKVFGASVVVYRLYGYILALITNAVLIVFFHQTIRRRGVFIFASLFCCLLISASLRFALGIVPLLILFRYLGSGRKLPIALSGLVLGISLLFSQEAGLCAVVAMAAFFYLEARRAGGYRQLAGHAGLVVMGCLLVLAPVLTYFYQQDALSRFFESVYGYPKLITLGYAALPFPHFSDFLAAPLSSGAYLPYWIIGIYLLAAIRLSLLLFLGQGNKDINFRVAVLVYGLFLFRVALGRSDSSHFINSSLPAFLLVFLMLDDLAGGAHLRSHTGVRTGRIATIAALMLSLVLVIGGTRFRDNLLGVVADLSHLTSRFTVQEMGVKLPQLRRGGVFFDPATAKDMMQIKNALDRYTTSGDYVLFFPNEAAYYFLFERRSPTRYVNAYYAVTTAQRLEMVADLERRKPAYVVYSLDSFRIDRVPEAVQVPEVVNYLLERYTPVENLGFSLILRRKGI